MANTTAEDRTLIGHSNGSCFGDNSGSCYTLDETLKGATNNDIGPGDPIAQGLDGIPATDPMNPQAPVWQLYLEQAEQADLKMVEGWNRSIDVQLVFAGLFSAVLTTFLVQAYTMLSPDPMGTTNTLLIELVYLQQGNDSRTHPLAGTRQIASGPSLLSQWLNCLWFASLALSLTSALVAMLAKQWLQAYSPQSWGTPRDRARSRQRAYQAMRTWHVGVIIDSMPIILHTSVLLFFAGLVLLLWPLEIQVAAVTVTIIAIASMFYCVTLILPFWFPDCPYHTPVSQYMRRNWQLPLSLSYLMAWRVKGDESANPERRCPPHRMESGDVIEKSALVDVNILYWLFRQSTEKKALRTAAQSIGGLSTALTDEDLRPLKDAGALDQIGRGFEELQLRMEKYDDNLTSEVKRRDRDLADAELYCRAWITLTWNTAESGRLLSKWGGIGRILLTMQEQGTSDAKVVSECAYASLWHTNWKGLCSLLSQVTQAELQISSETRCLLLSSIVRYADFSAMDGDSAFRIDAAAREIAPYLLRVLVSATVRPEDSQVYIKAVYALHRFIFHKEVRRSKVYSNMDFLSGRALVPALLQLARSPEEFGVHDPQSLSIIIDQLRVLAFDVGMSHLHLPFNMVSGIEKAFFNLFSAGRLSSCEDRVLSPLLRLLWHGYSVDSPTTAHLQPDKIVKGLLNLLQVEARSSRSVMTWSVRCLEMILALRPSLDVARAFCSADGVGAILGVVKDYNIPKGLSSYVELSTLCRYMKLAADTARSRPEDEWAHSHVEYIFASDIFEMLCTEVRPGELWIQYRSRECYNALSGLLDLRPEDPVWSVLHDKLRKASKLDESDESLLALIDNA